MSDALPDRLARFYAEASADEQATLLALFELAATADAEPAGDDVEGFTWRRPPRLGGPPSGPGAELGMINLQSLVSQRQEATQLASAMLDAMNDSTSSVIKNLK